MGIGPVRPLAVEKPQAIDLAQAARYFGARGGADKATQALLERCAAPLLAAATPRAVWREGSVESLTEAGILQGSDVMRHLQGCTSAVLLAVTLGPGADAQIRRAGLCVTDSDLMTPRKSITAVLGVSDHPVKGHLAGCGHCVLRTRCEYRKRGITCASE